MADFAAARTAQGFCFTDAVGREIVVVDVTFCQLRPKAIKGLGFAERRQSKAVENLGLTACKEAAAMRPGQKTNFAADRTHLIKGTAVRTDLIMGNDVTKDLLDKLLHNMGNIDFTFRIKLHKMFQDRFLGFRKPSCRDEAYRDP
mgnify:CR=1 FL=1